MIVIPIQFIIGLILAGIGIVLLIVALIADYVHDLIKKIRNKKNETKF